MNGSLRSRTRWLLLASGIDPASTERVAGRGRWTGADEILAKGTTIDRLRRMLFGASTEKTSQVVGEPPADADGSVTAPRPKSPGHGRNSAAA